MLNRKGPAREGGGNYRDGVKRADNETASCHWTINAFSILCILQEERDAAKLKARTKLQVILKLKIV